MLKFLRKHIDFNLIKISLCFALIHCTLFNSAVLIHKFGYVNSGYIIGILEIIKDFIYDVITLFVIFFALSIHRVVFILGSLFLFITGALASYYLFFFSISLTQTMMPSIYGTNLTEVSELISSRLIVWLTFSVSICIYSICHFKIQTTKIFFSKILSAVCLLITISNIINPKYSYLKTSFPLQYLHNSYVYFFGELKEYVREDLTEKFSFTDSGDEDVIGVLIVGESARYGNFGINGYERDTTPNLSKIDNLASFKAHSCASATYLAVPCMLSRYGEKDIGLINSETSVLSVFTKLNYDTALFGTQSVTKYFKRQIGGTFYDDVDFHIIPGSTVLILPNSRDGQLLEYLKKNISSERKKFIVLHTTGSHWNYANRYPDEFTKFKPDLMKKKTVDPSSCDRQELINSYDNSIFYTDFFISSVIEILKDRKAVVIYSSDHGESLGENGKLSHGSEEYVKEQREVPLMIWFSDKYKADNLQKWEAVESKKGLEISHDYIYHTILDCLNIESNSVDKSLSLCHK